MMQQNSVTTFQTTCFWWDTLPFNCLIVVHFSRRLTGGSFCAQAGALERMIQLNDAVWGDSDLGNRMQQLLDDINSGLDKFAAVVSAARRAMPQELSRFLAAETLLC